MAALRSSASELHNLELPIAANGQEQSSEQTTICIECSSFVNIVANIKDPAVIRKILDHLGMNVTEEGQLPRCCAPPRGVLFA